MKRSFIISAFLAILSTLLFTACQDEQNEVTPENPENLSKNSQLTNLLQRVASDFTSDDDLIDSTACFKIKLGYIVNVYPEGQESFVLDIYEEEYSLLLQSYIEDGAKVLITSFPLTLIYLDGSEVTVNSYDEYETLQDQCNPPVQPGTSIGCIDVNYPITIFGYDSDFQLANTYTIDSDIELFALLMNLSASEFYAISYPMSVTLSNGQVQVINNNVELAAAIQTAIQLCNPVVNPCPNPNVLTDSIVMYMPFANEIADLKGYYTPEIFGAYEFVPDRDGNEKGAISFLEGTMDNRISAMCIPQGNFMQDGKFTISLWFNRRDPAPFNTVERLFNSNAVSMFLGNNFAQPEVMSPFVVGDNLGDILYDQAWIDNGLNQQLGEWHHFAITLNGNLLLLYRDGVLRNAYTDADINAEVIGFTIAGYFKGYLDDLRVYKTDLSSSQIQTLYNLDGDIYQCMN